MAVAVGRSNDAEERTMKVTLITLHRGGGINPQQMVGAVKGHLTDEQKLELARTLCGPDDEIGFSEVSIQNTPNPDRLSQWAKDGFVDSDGAQYSVVERID